MLIWFIAASLVGSFIACRIMAINKQEVDTEYPTDEGDE